MKAWIKIKAVYLSFVDMLIWLQMRQIKVRGTDPKTEEIIVDYDSLTIASDTVHLNKLYNVTQIEGVIPHGIHTSS